MQKAIYAFIKSRGEATTEDVVENFQMHVYEIETQFALLRHCELATGQRENNRVYLTTFERNEARG